MDIQKSIIKKFRRKIWSKFVKVIKEYELIKEGDKIAVCISGGKDSFLLAKCLEELKQHGQFKFDLEFICIFFIARIGFSYEIRVIVSRVI